MINNRLFIAKFTLPILSFMNSKYILIFLVCFILIALPLCIFPINFFPGVIVFDINGTDFVEQVNLSLSYFFNLGLNEGDLDGVKAFYLTKQGWILAVCILVCLPALITYRVYLRNNNK